MNLNQLEYFVNAAETLNFTSTAKKFYISQTAITQQIKALEDHLGEELFYRKNKKLSLTPVGKVFYQECKAILIRTSDALEKVHLAANGIIGDLRIGVIDGYEKTNISDSIRNFHNEYPNVSLKFLIKSYRDLWSMLENNDLDIIFNTIFESFNEERYSRIKIEDYPVMTVLHPTHPLSGRNIINIKDFYNENFIALSFDDKDMKYENSILNYMNISDIKPNIIQYSNDIETILLMVSSGLGIALIPQFAVIFYNQSQNLSIIPVESDANLSLSINAIWNSHNTNSSIEKFVSSIYLK